ncbi:hypothetical protein FDG2_3423 [Candidatus Protofrankia californiensis]|uniref:Uncharacterized protein n=1 Tax=Candidatus Protofrankia californiensis TaxID=1839754 RepID=A0A1C3NZP9_9ACTN|nr:hypothetical protein FDG2_3423 [Candidatus Protofrankia californiensis]
MKTTVISGELTGNKGAAGANPATPTSQYQVGGLINRVGQAPEWFSRSSWEPSGSRSRIRSPPNGWSKRRASPS